MFRKLPLAVLSTDWYQCHATQVNKEENFSITTVIHESDYSNSDMSFKKKKKSVCRDASAKCFSSPPREGHWLRQAVTCLSVLLRNTRLRFAKCNWYTVRNVTHIKDSSLKKWHWQYLHSLYYWIAVNQVQSQDIYMPMPVQSRQAQLIVDPWDQQRESLVPKVTQSNHRTAWNYNNLENP